MKKSKLLVSVLVAALLTSALTVASSAAMVTTDITVSKASAIPTIDGKYDANEGWGDPVASIGWDVMNDYISDDLWESDEELLPQSVTTYFRWDEEHLYFCSVVVDPIHFNDNAPEDIGMAYAGDGLQFDLKSMADEDTGNRNRIFYGLTNDGEYCVNMDLVENGAAGEIGANAAWTECVITRDEDTKTTTYETVFDLTKCLPEASVSEGDSFYVRQIVLCTMDEGTEDIVDVNVPGMKEGTYAYWLLNLGGVPAGEAVAEEPAAEEPAVEETVAEEVVEEPAVEEVVEETAEETVVEEAVVETAEETVVEEVVEEAPQTFDFGIAAAAAAIASLAGFAVSKKH